MHEWHISRERRFPDETQELKISLARESLWGEAEAPGGTVRRAAERSAETGLRLS